MATKRADHVTCIADPQTDNAGKSLCGEYIASTFHFQNIEHAFLVSRAGGRQTTCPQCAKVVRLALSRK